MPDPGGEFTANNRDGSYRDAQARAAGMGTPPHSDEPSGEEPKKKRQDDRGWTDRLALLLRSSARLLRFFR